MIMLKVQILHFMKKVEYLEEILEKKAIVPRYCKEDLEYLNIEDGKNSFIEAFVLQKCFCDIPFHKLTESFQLQATGDNYLNEHSQYTKNLSNLINQVLNLDNVPDAYVDDVLNRLSFVKPLRGIMKRKFKRDDGIDVEIDFQKNFHDEHEWRYVPSIDVASVLQKDTVIANPYLLKMNGKGVDISTGLSEEKYDLLWLKYSYEDVRYIIVPDGNARIDIINTIMSISDDKFSNQSDVAIQKYILISKILVLEEIRNLMNNF